MLKQILILISLAASNGDKPVVIFDLDETLVNSQVRVLRILNDFSLDPWLAARYPAETAKLQRLALQDLKRYPLYIDETLADLGAEALSDVAVRPFVDAYLSNRYCANDWQTPGAAGYVKAVAKAGAQIVYLTGRNEPNMRECTVAFLKKNGFPKGKLIMKPTANEDDTSFKKRALAEIASLGNVIAGFENEPANLNAIGQAFPKAELVFVDTSRSSKPDRPHPRAAVIRDFTLPKP